MPKFALRIIDAVEGIQTFEKLLVDGIAPFDVFEKELEVQDRRSLEKIYFYMNEVANIRSLPNTKFKDVTPDKASVREYEFKEGNLRVYAIKKPGGKIIILGGYKNRQKKDYRTFRSLKQQYLEQISDK
jgi:putative component of toxin-antitoxin plasmid stabilization module